MAGSVCFNKRIYENSPKEENDAEMKRRREMLPIRVVTGLGSDVDRYVSQSKTLVQQILQLLHNNWEIVWGPAKGGSTTDRENKRIIIASNSKTGKSFDIAYVTSALAHEVGHAMQDPVIDKSSFDKCMDSFMVGRGSEAEAVLNQLRVHAEILNETCIDIFEEGREYEFMRKDFVNLYNQGMQIGDMTNARRKIAERYSEEYTSNTNPPEKYKDYYGNYCKKHTHH